ncbi:MAG: nucleoside recognition domain-containing protein [Candidatus Kryptoniota bacterium]
MLNYVWIGLVIIGVLTAAGNDIYDASTDRYRNGKDFELQYDTTAGNTVTVGKNYFEKFYDNIIESNDTLKFPALLKGDVIQIKLDDSAPQLWRTVAKTAGDEKQITAQVINRNGSKISIRLPTTSLVKTKAVLDAVISYSGTAVEIAIGLIGVMAFWLGIMKLAEDSGLIKIIARIMRPVMTRIFPDIPPDHPAIGAMIMNIAANVLGLNNAATPLGLKAMQELDSLNPKKGTATNAMVTFLAINTAGLTIIPATAIAVRAALGSKDPTIILMTSFFGAGLATIAGIAAAKMLQRLKVYRTEDKPPRAGSSNGNISSEKGKID